MDMRQKAAVSWRTTSSAKGAICSPKVSTSVSRVETCIPRGSCATKFLGAPGAEPGVRDQHCSRLMLTAVALGVYRARVRGPVWGVQCHRSLAGAPSAQTGRPAGQVRQPAAQAQKLLYTCCLAVSVVHLAEEQAGASSEHASQEVTTSTLHALSAAPAAGVRRMLACCAKQLKASE